MARLERLTHVVRSRQARQSGLLIGAQGVATLLSFAFTVLVTRSLDVATYGTFRYAMTFLALAMTVLQFGWPYSAARLLALQNDVAAQRAIVGASVVMLGVATMLGMAGTLIVVGTARMLGHPLPGVLIWVAPFIYVTLGQYMVSNVCQGLNRISVLALQQVLPYTLLLPVTALQVALGTYSLAAAIAGYVLVFSVVIAFGFARLRVSFRHWFTWARRIVRENRITGFPIYLGGICGVASAQITALWVAEYADSVRYGQYALALAVSGPLGVLVSAVGTVIFRSSASRSTLSPRVLAYSLGWGCALGGVYALAIQLLLVRAFGAEYGPSIRMAQLLGVGALMTGWGDIFQRFLGAQGLGRRLGLAAALTGGVAIGTAAVLLPRLDVYGAVVSSLMGAAMYLGGMLVLYRYHTARVRGSRSVGSGLVYEVERATP